MPVPDTLYVRVWYIYKLVAGFNEGPDVFCGSICRTSDEFLPEQSPLAGNIAEDTVSNYISDTMYSSLDEENNQNVHDMVQNVIF